VKLEAHVEGLADLEKLMTRSLPVTARRRVVQSAMVKAVKPVRDSIRAKYNALGGSGALARSVAAWRVRKALRGKPDTFASIEVGPKRSNKRALAQYFNSRGITPTPARLINGIRHGHLVEFGFTHRSGKSVAGKHILQSTAEAQFSNITTRFRHFWKLEIDKAVRKHRSGAKR